jgi:hypothetical protein
MDVEAEESVFWDEDYVNSQFPESTFNFIRPAQGYIDDNDVVAHLPCRRLHDWYLLRNGSFDTTFKYFSEMRVALNPSTQDMKNCILVGTLRSTNNEQSILVELGDELKYYTIDMSRDYRGYWIISESVKYWLQEPCQKKIKLKRLSIQVGGKHMESTADLIGEGAIEFPSQAQLHLFHRAQLGLLSNLIDLFIPSDREYHLHSLYNHTPEEVWTCLLSNKPELREYYKNKVQECSDLNWPLPPPIFDRPFDLELLFSSKFLHKYIEVIHPSFKTTKFYKSLQSRNLQGTNFAPSLTLQTAEQEEQWLNSATEAECRSLQCSWGEPDGGKPHNLRYPIELELENRFLKCKLPHFLDEEEGEESIPSSIFHSEIESQRSNFDIKDAVPLKIKYNDELSDISKNMDLTETSQVVGCTVSKIQLKSEEDLNF